MQGAKTALEIKTKNPDYSTKLKELAEGEEGNTARWEGQVAGNSASCAVKVPFAHAFCSRGLGAE